ncbi:uncharacterized protein E6C27_scaffold25G001200 [Cucumis melo var. makuwa]|uniref:1,4-alpha-D-glucan glucanohydrolase n=1 Tax=Cucumis melo var. makuwa TaxID=1194695 RepID=A0A5A7VLE0_CUCMM|nr:uncharacterized protein E6C27_scaffold25G001200 [Cucumis melo var. makuwa]
MGPFPLLDTAIEIFPRCPIITSRSSYGRRSSHCHLLVTTVSATRNWKVSYIENLQSKPKTVVFSSRDNSNDHLTDLVNDADGFTTGRSEVLETGEDEILAVKKALLESQTRQKAVEKERDQLLERLARYEAKQKEYVATILHDKELAISELEAARSLFNKKLEESVGEKFALESKLVLAKQDAIDLAVQVEKLAAIAFQQATSHILEDAKYRVSVAETSAIETSYEIEKQIRDATEGSMLSFLEQSKIAIEKALDVAEKASVHAKKAMATFTDEVYPLDGIASIQSENIKLKGVVNELESHLSLARTDVDNLKLELENARAQATASEIRAKNAEKVLVEFQELSREKINQQEGEIKLMMEKIKKDVADKKKAASKAFKVELEGIKSAIQAAKETAHSKDSAYMRRCEALQRLLRASEAATKMWQQRADMAESFLLKERTMGKDNEDAAYIVNGGRIDLLTDDESQKWKLLTDGPRREIPQWMARRIGTIRPKFPPRKIDVTEISASKFRSLDLPKLEEVWSIAQEKPKVGDALIEHVIEKETIEKKRKALERALQRKTKQWQRTPDQTKLEPGTGTGHEIVFQGFNWESWRRRWYLELAAKASDLSQSGITAVWLPPPTESVAPQGYMPSDLYNLNSSYGTEEELKYCIEEFHSQDLLIFSSFPPPETSHAPSRAADEATRAGPSVQTPLANLTVPPLSSSMAYSVSHVPIHVLPPNFVGEFLAHSNTNVQASSSGITQQQLQALQQQTAAIEATLGTTCNTLVSMYYKNPITSFPTLSSSYVIQNASPTTFGAIVQSGFELGEDDWHCPTQ